MIPRKQMSADEAVEQALRQAEFAHRGKNPEQEEYTGTALAFYKQLVVGGAVVDGETPTQDQFLNRAVEEYVAIFVEQ